MPGDGQYKEPKNVALIETQYRIVVFYSSINIAVM